MASRDPKLGVNWQQVHRESGMVYIENRSTVNDLPKDSEEYHLVM